MPSVTEKQREAIAIAEHHPEQLYKKNRGILNMTHQQMHDFASTTGLTKDQRKSTSGSPEFTDTEMKQGFRRIP
jgi:hypothetical protein